MISSIYFAIFTAVVWSMFANTELGWLSYVFSPSILVCFVIAESKYARLKQRLDDIEKRMKGADDGTRKAD